MNHLFIFDKNENLLDLLNSECYYDDDYKRQLNGEWSFTFYVKSDYLKYLEKPNKIGLYDREGKFQLFKIQECEDVFGNEESFEIYCVHDSYSLGELIIEDKRVIGGTARDAIAKCLENSNYSMGNVADLGEETLSFYFISKLQGLYNIVETYGGELDFRFELNENKTRIVNRYVDLKYRLGEDTGLRFTFDLNLKGVTRNRSSEGHFTVLYGRGKSLEVGEGYSRRLTFDEVAWNTPTNPLNKPLGDKFLIDPEAVARWGRIEGIYENDAIEDAEELLKATHRALDEAKEPKISYSATIEDLSNLSGYEHLKFVLGDSIIIQDEKYKLNNEARIVSEAYSIKNKKQPKQVTLGYLQKGISDSLSGGSITNPTITAPTDIEIDDGDFPNTLPSTPILKAKGLFSSIMLEWTFESKTYYNYEIYASKIQNFNPDSSNLIFKGKASSLLHEVKPSETWYYRARAINTHGEVTEMSDEVSATAFKISDATEYFEDVAIKEALIDTLSLDRGWFGQLKGQFMDVKNLVVTDGNNVRTMYVDDFGRVHMNVSELKINSKDVLNQEQTETLIEAKAGEISLSVAKNEVDNLQIGGANLLLNSDAKKQLDRADGVAFNEISYAIIDTYRDLVLTQDTSFVLSFIADRVGNTEFECFDTITFDVGWSHRWSRADIDRIIYVKGNTYKFIMKPKVLPRGVTIASKITFIAEYYYGGGVFYNVMLSEGDKALDWSPASQDIQSSIAKIDIKTDEINSTVNTIKQNLNDNYSTTSQMNSEIQQLADSITSEVVKIENSMAIDNLLANGNFTNELNNWHYRDHGSSVNYTLTANTDWTMVGKTALLLTQSQHPQGCDSGFTQIIEVKPNTNYTFTGYIASHRAEGMAIVKDDAGNWLVFDKTHADYDQYTGGADISKWKRVRLVYYSGNRNKLQLHLAMAKSNENGHVWFHDFMVTEGDTDLCWKPSERETRTRIDQLSDRITSTVSSIQTVDGKVNQAQSQIDQQAHQIASKVNSGDFSSLIQQNSSSVYAAISNGRGVHGVGIDTSGLYLFNNNLVTARLTEGKFHAYNSWNGRHMGYFGTNGDDLRACLYDTNTFSVYSNDTALLFRARYERDANYGNATLDMCGGINFIHKPGQDVGVNQILLGNDDRSDAYGYHNMSIRCWNSLGFQDNYGLTNMFFDVRRGRIIMKGGLYQNTQTPPSAYVLSNDPRNPFYSGVTSEQMVRSILKLETTVKVDTDDDVTMMILPNDDDLAMTMIDNQQHVDIASIVAGLVETVKLLNNRMLELESELNKRGR